MSNRLIFRQRQPIEDVAPTNFDYIVVVGGLMTGYRRVSPTVFTYLRRAAALNVGLIGACVGSFVLAKAGVMNGRRCCVHHYHVTEFQNEFPQIEVDAESLFTVDGDRITCPGGASVIDMALYLVEQHCGRSSAVKVVCQLIIEEARRNNHPQTRVRIDGLPFIHDAAVKRALLLMQRNIGRAGSISQLCGKIGVDVKTLERKFQATLQVTPYVFFRRMRIERAKRLIEETDQPLTRVATDCGFADASHLTRTFREVFDCTPSEFRRRHAVVKDSPCNGSVLSTND